MDVAAHLERIREAPSYARVADLVPAEALPALEAVPEYGALVIAGKRKRLTRAEVDERLPRFLEILGEQLEGAFTAGGGPVDRRAAAKEAGISYEVVLQRSWPESDTFDAEFAGRLKLLRQAEAEAAADLVLWMSHTSWKEFEDKGYHVKQLQPSITLLKAYHPDFRDQVRVSGRVDHVHAHLVAELGAIEERTKPPAKLIEANQ